MILIYSQKKTLNNNQLCNKLKVFPQGNASLDLINKFSKFVKKLLTLPQQYANNEIIRLNYLSVSVYFSSLNL